MASVDYQDACHTGPSLNLSISLDFNQRKSQIHLRTFANQLILGLFINHQFELDNSNFHLFIRSEALNQHGWSDIGSNGDQIHESTLDCFRHHFSNFKLHYLYFLHLSRFFLASKNQSLFLKCWFNDDLHHNHSLYLAVTILQRS